MNPFVIAIIFLSLLNLVRIATYMIGANVYDIQAHRRSKLKPTNKRKRAVLKKPYLTVIVPAHNEAAVIGRCLDSIFANDYSHKRVIVVDDGSEDNTYNKVRYYKHKHRLHNLLIIKQSNQGKAAAINKALRKHARGSLVMVLDADSALSSDAIAKTVRHFDDPQIICTAANVHIIRESTLLSLIQQFEYIISYRLKRAQTALNVEYIIGGVGSTYRHDILKLCGGYDSDTVTEDIDLSMKLISRFGNRTQRLVYASDIIVYTESVGSLVGLVKQRFRWKYGRLQTFLKNRSMFFSRNKAYDKRLTYIQLPYTLFSDFLILTEPLVLYVVIYTAWSYQEFGGLLGTYLLITVYMTLTIMLEDSFSLRERLKLMLIVPTLYFLMLTLSLVEFAAMVLSLIRAPRLRRQDNTWKHVARSGHLVV